MKLNKNNKGFTLIELIIYIGIVSIILTSISFLMLDLLSGQTKNDANQEANQNSRFVVDHLVKDIRSAQDIISLSADTLVLDSPGDNITYNFDNVSLKLTRQIGSGEVVEMHSDQVQVEGSFEDSSFLDRSKNVSINLEFSFKNPSDLIDYRASAQARFTVELRGKR